MKATKTLHAFGHDVRNAYDLSGLVKGNANYSGICVSRLLSPSILSGVEASFITIDAREVVDVYGCRIKS